MILFQNGVKHGGIISIRKETVVGNSIPKSRILDSLAVRHMSAVEARLQGFAEEIAKAFPSIALSGLMLYMPHFDGHFRCPYCWLIYREVNALAAINTNELGVPKAHLRCKTCEENFDLLPRA